MLLFYLFSQRILLFNQTVCWEESINYNKNQCNYVTIAINYAIKSQFSSRQTNAKLSQTHKKKPDLIEAQIGQHDRTLCLST